MNKLGAVALFLGTWAGEAFVAWWGGRVLLPAMGLTAPSFSTWLWGLLPLMLAALAAQTIKAIWGD